jgi:GNAT superfamily N-acetyltransferase
MLALPEKSTNGRTYPNTPADQELPAGPPCLLIRPIKPSDSEALQHAFEHELSSASRYLRFHAAISRLPDRMVHYLTHVDGIDHVALVAFECGESLPAAGVGVARFVRVAGWPDTAELAVTVVDHAQGHGIGRLLVEALGAAAQERGIRTFNLVVLGSNRRVRDWLLRLGAVGRSSEAGVITFQLPVEALVTSSANSNRSSAA